MTCWVSPILKGARKCSLLYFCASHDYTYILLVWCKSSNNISAEFNLCLCGFSFQSISG